MNITKAWFAVVAAVAITACGGSDALNGEMLGPGGAGGSAGLGRGTGGAAGGTAASGGGGGAAAAGGASAGGSGMAGAAAAAGSGSAGSAAGGAPGGAGGSAGTGIAGAGGHGGAGGGAGTLACDQPILDAASKRDGLVPVTCTLTAGVCFCGPAGAAVDLECAYLPNDRTPGTPFCTGIGMTLDPCSLVIGAAAKIDGPSVTCGYVSGRCYCGLAGQPADLSCIPDSMDSRVTFCDPYQPPPA